MRILTAAIALLVSFSASAQNLCPSMQWTQTDTSTTPDWVRSIETIDYDEDGKLDLVGIADLPQTDALVWWKGAGDGTFGDAVEITSAPFLGNVVVGELTADAYLDVAVVTSSTYNLNIYPGTGSGRGTLVTNYFGNIPHTMRAVNIDGDAVAELITSYGPGLFSVHDRVGGTFIEKHYELTPENLYASEIVSADFDADGFFDVAVALREGLNQGSSPNDHVRVYFGNANGTYGSPLVLATPQPWGLATADLNEDGMPDLVVSNWIQATSDPGTIEIFRNTGSRTFAKTTLVADKPGSIGDPVEIDIVDVDEDDNLDLLVSVTNGSWIATFPGLGNGTFRTPSFYSDSVGSLATGDFNGDGNLDIGLGSSWDVSSLTRSCATQVNLYTESVMITAGTDAILHAHISGFRNGMSGPYGSVTLYEGQNAIVTGQLGSTGVITFTLGGQTLSVGEHELYAVFSGNSELAGGTSSTITQRVTNSVTSVTIGTPVSPVHGKAFTVNLSINGAGGGYDWVDVKIDGGTPFRKYTSTPLALTLATGQHTIEARYPGSNWYPRSPWASLTFNVAKDTPAIMLDGQLHVRQGTAHNLTVTVSTPGTLGKPTGNVHLYEDTNTWLATVPLSNGVASFSRQFARGSHLIRFVYAGDANFNGAEYVGRIETLPNVAFALDARAVPTGIQIIALPMEGNAGTQLQRRVYGTSTWQTVPNWTNVTMSIDSTVTRGVAYEYQMTGSITGGSPVVSNIDSALFFTDDALNAGTGIKRKHFTELATAVNLLRAQAGLSTFAFEASFTAPGIIRASHLTSLRTALTEARTALGMITPTLTTVSAGGTVMRAHVNETRDLAR